MNSPDLQIARQVLGVLHDVEEVADNHPDIEMIRAIDRFEGAGIFDYNLDRKPAVNLPIGAQHALGVVEDHLRSSKNNDPWGLIADEFIVLKLSNQPYSNNGKIFLFSSVFMSEFLEKLFPNARITSAERKTLLQSLAGISLKKAADLDKVSYETKKSQLKAVFQKTEQNKQQALSSFLITHLTFELAAKVSRQRPGAESDEMFFHYVDTYMGSYVRASVVQKSTRNRFRIIELGDPNGTPVVCVHHLGLINFSEEEIQQFHRQRIRLICPLRHGALGPVDQKLTSSEHFEHAIAGIDIAASLTGLKKVTLVSLLSGGLYAINYHERHAEKVDKLIMLSASYKNPAEKMGFSLFKNNLHDLAISYENTLEQTVSVMLEGIDQPDKLKRVVKESNNNNPADNQTIDELFYDAKQVDAMQHRLKYSPVSIVQDLKTQAVESWKPLQRIKRNSRIYFIHGSEDSLIPIDRIKNLVNRNSEMELHIVEGAGNWIFGRYTRQTSIIIRNIIDEAR